MVHVSKIGYYHTLTILLLIYGCAKVNMPSGGPKDKNPPVVIKNVPENGAKNFRGKKLVITFNEFVVLDKINEKFMISPPMRKKPNVYIRGKNVVVEYEDTLRDSTTYTFYFLDAIRDLNEGNILENYQFVFSTGTIIDSLSVTGNVYKAYNLEVPENTIVQLYRNLADSAVVKELPDYISRVEPNGSFRINNVHEGKYRLYGLKDNDNSKNYNLIDEEFAFHGSPIEVTPGNNYSPIKKDTSRIKSLTKTVSDTSLTTSGITLILFKAQKKAHYLTSSVRNLPYMLFYTLSVPPDSLDFKFSIPNTDETKYFIEKSINNDSIRIWLTDSVLYSQPQITTVISYPFTDSTGSAIQKKDTIALRFLAPKQTRGKVKRVPLKVSYNISSGNLKPGHHISLTSQTPFRQPDTSRIRLYELLTDSKVSVPFTLIKNASNSCRIDMMVKLAEGKKYLFIADSAALGNIYREYCDSTGIKFSVMETKNFGKMVVNLKNVDTPIILQLLDNKESLVSEKYITFQGKVEFPLLEKGSYRLRAVFDLNGDGKWTTGDFFTGRQPEPVSYYPNEIEIRTDWISDQDWILGAKNYKPNKLREIKKK
jgi:hypothetical protein